MIIKELILELKTYPEELNVKIYDEYGSSYKFTEIGQILENQEIEESPEEEFIIIIPQ